MFHQHSIELAQLVTLNSQEVVVLQNFFLMALLGQLTFWDEQVQLVYADRLTLLDVQVLLLYCLISLGGKARSVFLTILGRLAAAGLLLLLVLLAEPVVSNLISLV